MSYGFIADFLATVGAGHHIHCDYFIAQHTCAVNGFPMSISLPEDMAGAGVYATGCPLLLYVDYVFNK